jgi:hypothetical protein
MAKLIWTTLALEVAATLAWAAAAGLEIKGAAGPLIVIGTIGALAYLSRRQPRLSLPLTALAQIFLFMVVFGPLMYLGARVDAPLIDPQLQAADAVLGFQSPNVVSWVREQFLLDALLWWAYDSSRAQMFLVLLILGLMGDRRALESFTFSIMLSLLAIFVLFVIAPAEGPFSAFGFSTTPDQARYLDQLRSLRSGIQTEVDFGHLDGLVTFPSFHTTWALLLAAACRRPMVRVPATILNAAVIVATMTTGWHYLSDVLAGAGVYLAVSAVVRRIESASNVVSFSPEPTATAELAATAS